MPRSPPRSRAAATRRPPTTTGTITAAATSSASSPWPSATASRLTPEETWLREEVARIRRLVPAPAEFAVVSVPGIEERVDAAMRRAILQHEIGHGHFFADARFAAHVERVWREVFTEAERAAFRAFLAREGYDPAIEEVMMNEAMAYLIFTPDPRFFQPAHAGLTDARAERCARRCAKTRRAEARAKQPVPRLPTILAMTRHATAPADLCDARRSL